MKKRTYEVWLRGDCVAQPILITCNEAVLLECGRLKFIDGFFGSEVAGFDCGVWHSFCAIENKGAKQ